MHPPPPGPASSVHHASLDVDSDEPERENPPSPTPTVPGHISTSRKTPAAPASHASTPADPNAPDYRNRPWPPADDKALIQFKLDSKSRLSWKTIATKLARSAETCQIRWKWLKDTNSPLLQPDIIAEHHAEDSTAHED